MARKLLPLACAALLASAAGAQDASVATEPSATGTAEEPACELHVWPAERVQSMTTGVLGPGLLNSAIEGGRDQRNRTAMSSALDPEGQAAALEPLDLPASLALPPSKVILHKEPLDRKTINKISTRRAPSTSNCYAELMVADQLFQQDWIMGRTLRTLFMLRDFGTKTDKPVIYKAWGGNPIKLFPPKEGEDVEAAYRELGEVFMKNFEEFARNARKSREARPGRAG
jgi:hypothetical protein